MSSQAEIIYASDDRPPFWQAVLVAVQHFFAVYIPIVTPSLIICSMLRVDVQTAAYIMNMGLLLSGVATIVQVKRFGYLGTGLLNIQGTNSDFIIALVAAGQVGGLPLVFGLCFVGSICQIGFGCFLRACRRIITPAVSGVTVLIIGLSLLKVAVVDCAGGDIARQQGQFASQHNLMLAAIVIVTTVLASLSANKYLKAAAIFLGIMVGYVAAFLMHMVTFADYHAMIGFHFAYMWKHGFSFNIIQFIPVLVIFLVATIESVGDITATELLSGKALQDKEHVDRLSRGVIANGVFSGIAALLGAFPVTCFAQNNGIIQWTGVASRYVGYFVAGWLLLFGIFPFFSQILLSMPKAVLGGAMLIMFGSIAAAGIRIIASEVITRRAMIIVSTSLALALAVDFVPEIFQHFSPAVQHVFGSGITVGCLVAILLSVVDVVLHRGIQP